jgi:hypothetical protein
MQNIYILTNVCLFAGTFMKKYCPGQHRKSHCWAEQGTPDTSLYSYCMFLVRCSDVALCCIGTDCWCVAGSLHHWCLVSETSWIILGWHSIKQGHWTAFLASWHLWGSIRIQTDSYQHISLLLAAHRLLWAHILKVSVHWYGKFIVWGQS